MRNISTVWPQWDHDISSRWWRFIQPSRIMASAAVKIPCWRQIWCIANTMAFSESKDFPLFQILIFAAHFRYQNVCERRFSSTYFKSRDLVLGIRSFKLTFLLTTIYESDSCSFCISSMLTIKIKSTIAFSVLRDKYNDLLQLVLSFLVCRSLVGRLIVECLYWTSFKGNL